MDTNPARILIEELGSENVLTDEQSRFSASFDNTRLSFLPDLVIRPLDEEQVAFVLQIANKHLIPVTVRGGGTAATGATAPVKGGWVLDLGHWENLHIDEVSGLAYVQPGVRTADVSAAAEAAGWFYPPDPSSYKHSTIGGNIACNAGGMRCAKYGVTRDYVMALEGFLPTGEWVKWGANLRKFAAGYNIRDLWIGSEGTLGVVTGAVLKLIPKPAARGTFLFAFETEKKAIAAVREILKRRLTPSILEFLDRQSVECTLKEGFQLPFRKPLGFTPAILLVEVDGAKARVDEDKVRLMSIMEKRAAASLQAKTAADAETLWAIRRKCSKAMFQLGDSKLNEDVVVPLDSQEALLDFTLRLKEEIGLATPTFGHAADGNFHVHVMYNRKDPQQRETAEKAVHRIMQQVVDLGGVISGEHGIGLAKSPFLEIQHSAAEINAMKAVKRALDPNNILNPGKIFEPFRVWEHEPVQVKLAWDH